MKHSSPDLSGIMQQRTTFTSGPELRDQGIARAEAHADRKSPDLAWTILANGMFYSAIHELDRFQTADFRKWAENRGLPAPPDARAYGGIIKRAVKAGLIVADGYAPTQDPIAHNRPAVVWKVAR